jgi:hypothetical protein
MSRIIVLVALALASGAWLPLEISAQTEALPVSYDAEWRLTEPALQGIHQECAARKAPDFGECFIESMRRLHASPQAVAFAEATGNTGYLERFMKVGPVDLTFVRYPFRANENEGWTFVNGDPRIIDVDTCAALEKGQLDYNPRYKELKAKFPNIMMFPGDRGSDHPPEVVQQANAGGLRFAVDYKLLDGCHACKQLGRAQFTFDFDSQGKFLGTTLLKVE